MPGVTGSLVADVIHGAVARKRGAGQGGACSWGPSLWLIQLWLGKKLPVQKLRMSDSNGHKPPPGA